MTRVRVLFVCLGNICRSPTAHGVFQQRVDDRGFGELIHVDSAGTAAWHTGKSPDHRSIAAAANRGYDLSRLTARQATVADFAHFDYLLAMDRENLRNLKELMPTGFAGELSLFLDYAPQTSVREVPDPYYGGSAGFDTVLDLVEAASDGLIAHLADRYGLTPRRHQ